MYQGGWKLPASKWANPYKVVGEGAEARELALQQYEAHVRANPSLMASLAELGGKRLGCWCTPLPCHGDVLVKLWKQANVSADETKRANVTAGKPKQLLPLPSDPVWDELEHLFG